MCRPPAALAAASACFATRDSDTNTKVGPRYVRAHIPREHLLSSQRNLPNELLTTCVSSQNLTSQTLNPEGERWRGRRKRRPVRRGMCTLSGPPSAQRPPTPPATSPSSGWSSRRWHSLTSRALPAPRINLSPYTRNRVP